MQIATDRSRFRDIPRFGLFTEDHDALRSAVRDFVENELRPHAEEWERERDFPVRAVFRDAAKMGLFGAKYEEAYGGTGPDLVADAVITEELTRCGSWPATSSTRRWCRTPRPGTGLRRWTGPSSGSWPRSGSWA